MQVEVHSFLVAIFGQYFELLNYQVHDDVVQMNCVNHLCGLRVVLHPDTPERVEALVSHTHVRLLRRLGEAFKDDSNEEIEYDDVDHEDECNEVENRGTSFAASLETLLLLGLVGLVEDALEEDRWLPSRVIHDSHPVFSCGDAQEGEQRSAKVLKISMDAQSFLKLHVCKQIDSKHRKQK